MSIVKRILIVNGQNIPASLASSLGTRGCLVSTVHDGARAAELLNATSFDLVVIDLDSIDDSNLVLDSVGNITAAPKPSVLVLGEWGTGLPSMALSMGADAYERSPTSLERMIDSVERLLKGQAVAAGAGE